jgi:phosphoserine aminotransferase
VSERILNFSAGPAVLPEEVLEEAREAIWNLNGTGIGILEHSHRGKAFGAVLEDAVARCRALAEIGPDHEVIFLQGGASLQFAMLPANFLAPDAVGDYLDTGSWSKKAIAEVVHYGKAHVAASSKDANYSYIPSASETRCSDAPTYLHFTSNNTIFGTQWRNEPEAPASAWLACDASSDIFSRPIDVSKYGLIYAGAQKNLGPAGATLVVLRRDLLERVVRELPTMLRYATYVENTSLYNTPPAFSIYVMGRVFAWIEAQGGLKAMAERNAHKAALLYDALDASDFYVTTARGDSRSHMNVTFTTPSAELDGAFLAEASAAGFDGLKGHRSVGGMRASIYNAFPESGCRVLAEFIEHFAATRG